MPQANLHPYRQRDKTQDTPSFFETVADQAQTCLVVLDEAHCIVWANARMRELFGVPERPLARSEFLELAKDRRDSVAVSRMRSLLESGEGGAMLASRSVNGDGLTFEWSAGPSWQDETGRQLRLLTGREVGADEAAQDRIHQLSTIIDNTEEAIVCTDVERRVTYFNKEARKLYGFRIGQKLGIVDRNRVPDDEREKMLALNRSMMATGEPQAVETVRFDRNGDLIPVFLRLSPLRNRRGEISGYVAMSYDITTRVKIEEAWQQADQRARELAQIIESIDEAVVLVDRELVIRYCNVAAEKLYGYPVSELVGKPNSLLQGESADAQALEYIEAARQGRIEKAFTYETVRTRKDGTEFPVELRVSPLYSEDGRLAGWASIGFDISERKEAADRLRTEASTDALTGLMNRRQFMRQATHERNRAQRYGRSLSLILIDIDHFKSVNDTHGHHVGDTVLEQIARCSQSLVRADVDLVARLGGEEFVILLPETNLQRATDIAERLRRTIAEAPAGTGDHSFRVTASFGVAEWAEEPSIEELLRRADEALYRAKKSGRDRVECAL